MSFFAKVVLGINNLILANGPGAAGTNDSSSSSAISDIIAKILQFLGSFVTLFWGVISGFIYKIAKLCLNIVDLLQFFVQKLVGIDIWSVGGKGLSSLSDLSEADVILRFILRPEIQRVFWAIVGIGIVLVIIFTIISIIKSNYAAVTDEADKVENKPSKIIKKSLRSLFLFALVPILVIFGIVGSNAVLASICNAIRGDNNLTIGGSIFTAASYDANKYREYASAGLRVPMLVDDATMVVNPMYYSTKNDMMELFYDLVMEHTKIPYVTNNSEFINRQLKKGQDGGWGTWTTSATDFIYRSEIAEMGNNASTQGGFKDDFEWFYSRYCDSEVLNDKKVSEPIMKSIYDGNITANKKYYRIKFNFDETFTVTDTVIFPNTSVTAKVFENSLSYNDYESFATIPLEYYVMADVIEFAIEQYTQLYYVNANNKAINWDNIDEYDKSMGDKYGSKGMFYVSYYDGTNRAYWSTPSSTSENDGATYIICQKSSDGMTYVPLTQNNSKFSSSFLSKSYGGAIVARGVFAEDNIVPLGYNKPTVISEKEVDNSGNEITISKSSTISTYDLGSDDFAKFKVFASSNETVLSTSKVAYYTFDDKVALYDRYSRPINTNLVIDTNFVSGTYTTYIEFDKFEQSANYYLEEFGIRSSTLTTNKLEYSLYAEVKYDIYKVKDTQTVGETRVLVNGGNDFYICANLRIVGITGGTEYDASTLVTMGTFDSYIFKGWAINPVVVKSYKNLVVREGNIYEVGTNALVFSTNDITSNMLSSGSQLKNTNLNAFKNNPIKPLPTPVLYEYDTERKLNSANNPEIGGYYEKGTVYYYNEYKMPVDKDGKLGGTDGDRIERRLLTATFTEFMYLHFLRDNSNKIVAVAWSYEADNSPLTAVDGTTLFIASITAVVDFDAYTDSSSYFNNKLKFEITNINTAELKEISLTAQEGYNVNLNNYFEVSNNRIYCKDLGKTVINATDVKNAITINTSTGEYNTLTGEVEHDQLIIIYNNIKLTDKIWKMSSIANYSNYFIYFSHGDITNTPFFDFRISLVNPSPKAFDAKFVFRFQLRSAYYYSYYTAYRLDAGGFLLDYNFRTATGIGISNLFTTANINPLILIFSTMIVLSVFLKIIWGLIARIYEIVILYILMPAYASTIVIDQDSERFRRWKDAILEKILMAYGMLITFNLYLVLLPLLKTITTDFIQWNDLPTTITGFINSNFISNISGFGSNFIANFNGSNIITRLLTTTSELTQSQMVYASFINKVIYVLFFLVLTTILSTAPKMINKILGGEDLDAKSEDTQKAVKKNIETAGEYTSGRAAVRSVKSVASSVVSAVPGGQSLSKAITKSNAARKESNKLARERRKENAAKLAYVKQEEKLRNKMRLSGDENEESTSNRYARRRGDVFDNEVNDEGVQATSARRASSLRRRAGGSQAGAGSTASGERKLFENYNDFYSFARKRNVKKPGAALFATLGASAATALAVKDKIGGAFKSIKNKTGKAVGKAKDSAKASMDNVKTSKAQRKTVKSTNKAIKKDFKEQKKGYINSTYHAAKYTNKGKERNKVNTFIRANLRLTSDTLHSVLGVMKRPLNKTRRHQVELQRRLRKSNVREGKLIKAENRVDKKIVKQTQKDPSLSNAKLNELSRRKDNIEKAKKAAAGRNIVLREKVAKTTAKQLGIKHEKAKADTIAIPNKKGSAKDQRTAFARMSTAQFNEMLKKSSDFQKKLDTAVKNTQEKINRNIDVKKNSSLVKELNNRLNKINQHVEELKKEKERRDEKLRREKNNDNKSN